MSEERPPKFTLISNMVRVVDCSNAVAVMSPAKPCTDRPCCCECDCDKRKVHEWTMQGDEEYTFPEDVFCNNDYCKCEKWEIITRRTQPAYGPAGYPRVEFSGSIFKTCLEDNSAEKCCLSYATGNPDDPPFTFRSHLGMKDYRIWYELWVMCNDSGLYSPGGDWGSSSSWYQDPGHTLAANRTPTASDNVVVSGAMTGSGEVGSVRFAAGGSGFNFNVDLSASRLVTFSNGIDNLGTLTGAATFSGGSNRGTVLGTAVFTGDSKNQGNVSGSATFSALAENRGTINGDATFQDAAENHGTVTGNATFDGHTKNLANIVGTATFNGSSENVSGGQAFAGATFNDNTKNMGQITGNATFNGHSTNGDPEGGEGGLVNGDAVFNECARNFGEVTGTETYNIERKSCDWYGRFDPPLKGDWITNGFSRRLMIIGNVNREALVARYGNSLTRVGGPWQKCPPEGCFAYPETYPSNYDFCPNYEDNPNYLDYPGNPMCGEPGS